MIKSTRIGATRALQRALLCIVAGVTMILAAPDVVSPASAAGLPAGAPTFIFAPYNAATKGVIRASFHYTITPGTTIHDSLVLANPTNYEQTFRIWGADAYNTALQGALALRPVGTTMTQVGTWITLPTGGANYGVNAGQEVVLNFAVTVPPNAFPGDHVGGIEALDVTAPQGTGSGTKITVHEGIGVPIFITVPGPRHPSAAVTDVSTADSVPWLAFANGSSDARVGYQIVNTGNTIIRGKVHVWVTDIFGQTVKTFPDNVIGNLLPGQLADFAEPLWKSLPIAGPQTVHVIYSPTGAKPATGTATFWVVPWLLIILIVALLLALGVWLWRRHRRKIAAADGAGGPQGDAKGPAVASKTQETGTAEVQEGAPAKEPVTTP